MSRSSVGTLPWARRTRGVLGRFDRLRLLAQAMLAEAQRRFRGRGRAPFTVDAASLRIPDSSLCVAASELLGSTSEPWLVNHCLRTFLWASIFGKSEQRSYDEELLFVAAALHDLGLTPAAAGLSPTSAKCFAVEGAFAAEAFLAARGVAEARAERIAEAISLHLNVRVPLAHGVEAHLLQAGAALDVIGARYRKIAASTRDDVLSRYPRMEWKENVVRLMKEQSGMRPRSRAAFLCSHGFITMIRTSPFAS